MGPGTFEAKFIPLASVSCVEKIYILRAFKGPKIHKLSYLLLPSLFKKTVFFKIFIPISLAYFTKKKKCDLIIAYHFIPHAIYAYMASIFTGTPFIFAQTGLDIQRQVTNKLFKYLVRVVLSRALFINVPGYSSKSFWINFGIDKGKINILHSTIDTDSWKPDKEVQPEYDFIFLGRLDPVKRIDLIIEGFNSLLSEISSDRSSKLLIVGAGPEEKKLKDLVSNLKLDENITFTGFIDNPLIFLQKSRFLVMSSVTEGLPTAMMQAMACGVIPITNTVGNIGDLVIDKKTGIVHKGNTPLDLCESMKYALSICSKDLINMKQAAREIIVDNHSNKKAMMMWSKLFQTLPSINQSNKMIMNVLSN